MIRSICLLLAVLLVSSRVEAEELTIAFWNVQNLLDEHDDPLLPYDEKASASTVRERLGKDAQVIRGLDADILGLAEVENMAILRQLVSGYLSRSEYKYFTLIDGTDPRGIDCAILSRFPCTVQTFDIPDFPRDLLVARFTTSGDPFYVIVNHWKSRRNDSENNLRLTCAKAAADCIQELIYGIEGRPVPVVLVGDFNDDPTDESLKYLEKQGLRNTMNSISEDLRWTHGHYDRDASSMNLHCFDQVLINQQAVSGGSIRWKKSHIYRPSFMINDRRSFNGRNIPLPIDDYRDRIGYSDHFPVIATFEVNSR
ncbi:endonuclease/exonuclease/phosphatase family protein [Rubinisphaera margarita]|uniref:endonuclease/exonuclease/phosphatase family protein n=1 Tax=Rubinisphaera margarita TaxID=2909586 RepID=UPI001EE79950|nr:endonuclease/exonuclease/phosphatase family protein [Rubinisphaera margarita]MCG6154688.1 endonuclease/exonuclease/phosphatase family protein [Rubinisphaera margarita]